VDETGKQKKKYCGKLLPYNEIERIGTLAYQKKSIRRAISKLIMTITSYFFVNFRTIYGTFGNLLLDTLNQPFILKLS